MTPASAADPCCPRLRCIAGCVAACCMRCGFSGFGDCVALALTVPVASQISMAGLYWLALRVHGGARVADGFALLVAYRVALLVVSKIAVALEPALLLALLVAKVTLRPIACCIADLIYLASPELLAFRGS